jgi:hypothetical protein
MMLQRPMNTRDQVSLVSKESNYRPCPVSWKGPLHEKCIVDKVQVTSELLVLICIVT